jgi:hypothetical protein
VCTGPVKVLDGSCQVARFAVLTFSVETALLCVAYKSNVLSVT